MHNSQLKFKKPTFILNILKDDSDYFVCSHVSVARLLYGLVLIFIVIFYASCIKYLVKMINMINIRLLLFSVGI